MTLSREIAQETPRRLIAHLLELEIQLARLTGRRQSESEDSPRIETIERHIASTKRCIEETREKIAKKMDRRH